MQAAGCLLIGEGTILERLDARLGAENIPVIRMMQSGNLLADARWGLYAAARAGKRACVAAEGEMWAAALALGTQLNVDRIVLLFPRDDKAKRDRHLERLKAYVRRNLFFCVSDVLVIEGAEPAQFIDKLCGRMTNADIWRMHTAETEADSAVCTAVRFLLSENLSRIAE